MPIVTLSSKNQITLPVEIVRSMGLKPGDKLIAEALDWRIVMMKESENRLERYVGSLRGVYGKTVEEIDRYVREERASPDRDEWEHQFYDIINGDPDSEAIVEWLSHCPKYRCPEPDLWRIQRINPKRVEEALQKLVTHGGVRKIPAPPGVKAYKWQYYLVRDFVPRVLA